VLFRSIPAVPFGIMLDGKIGYVPVQNFNETSTPELAQQIIRLQNEGAKVYQTDSWGLEGPEGRIDSPAYNTTSFTGESPWTGRQMELIDTRAEYERYLENQ